MITEDINIAKEIFSLLDEGILNDYDSFIFKADVHDSFIECELSVISEGIENSDPETDYNSAILYDLIKDLKNKSIERDEEWKSFIMTYTEGGEVKTKFNR